MRWLARVVAPLGLLGTLLFAPQVGATTPGTSCPPPAVGRATCFAVVAPVQPEGATTTPTGFSPAEMDLLYGWAKTGGAGRTIAIVDAYSDTTIRTDLARFDAYYGLPAASLTVVQPTGTPPVTYGWDLETSLDVEWAHALAPQARILLVEARVATYGYMFNAVRYASSRAQYVSMSWGGLDSRGETAFDSSFSAGVSYFAASGDTGAEVVYPSASPDVVSVGGTTVTLTQGTWSGESGWKTSGGGCSYYEYATTAQRNYPGYPSNLCTGNHRATPDLSLDGNPTTGVAIYDSTWGTGGWVQVGGTSVATVLAAAHAASLGIKVTATVAYGNHLRIYDVVNGHAGSWSCHTGYDLCSGLGAWNTAHGTGGTTPPPPATPPPPPPPPAPHGIHITNGAGMTVDPATGGYWVVGSDGGVFSFDAPYFGSVPGLGIHISNIVGIASTPTGHGYYLAGSDGGVFAFGNARYQGSLPGLGIRPAQPIVGIVASGSGYYLVGRDGGIFSFGAPFHGSVPGTA